MFFRPKLQFLFLCLVITLIVSGPIFRNLATSFSNWHFIQIVKADKWWEDGEDGGDYEENQYDENQYDENQYEENQYDENQYDENQYEENQYDENQYSENQNSCEEVDYCDNGHKIHKTCGGNGEEYFDDQGSSSDCGGGGNGDGDNGNNDNGDNGGNGNNNGDGVEAGYCENGWTFNGGDAGDDNNWVHDNCGQGQDEGGCGDGRYWDGNQGQCVNNDLTQTQQNDDNYCRDECGGSCGGGIGAKYCTNPDGSHVYDCSDPSEQWRAECQAQLGEEMQHIGAEGAPGAPPPAQACGWADTGDTCEGLQSCKQHVMYCDGEPQGGASTYDCGLADGKCGVESKEGQLVVSENSENTAVPANPDNPCEADPSSDACQAGKLVQEQEQSFKDTCSGNYYTECKWEARSVRAVCDSGNGEAPSTQDLGQQAGLCKADANAGNKDYCAGKDCGGGFHCEVNASNVSECKPDYDGAGEPLSSSNQSEQNNPQPSQAQQSVSETPKIPAQCQGIANPDRQDECITKLAAETPAGTSVTDLCEGIINPDRKDDCLARTGSPANQSSQQQSDIACQSQNATSHYCDGSVCIERSSGWDGSACVDVYKTVGASACGNSCSRDNASSGEAVKLRDCLELSGDARAACDGENVQILKTASKVDQASIARASLSLEDCSGLEGGAAADCQRRNSTTRDIAGALDKLQVENCSDLLGDEKAACTDRNRQKISLTETQARLGIEDCASLSGDARTNCDFRNYQKNQMAQAAVSFVPEDCSKYTIDSQITACENHNKQAYKDAVNNASPFVGEAKLGASCVYTEACEGGAKKVCSGTVQNDGGVPACKYGGSCSECSTEPFNLTNKENRCSDDGKCIGGPGYACVSDEQCKARLTPYAAEDEGKICSRTKEAGDGKVVYCQGNVVSGACNVDEGECSAQSFAPGFDIKNNTKAHCDAGRCVDGPGAACQLDSQCYFSKAAEEGSDCRQVQSCTAADGSDGEQVCKGKGGEGGICDLSQGGGSCSACQPKGTVRMNAKATCTASGQCIGAPAIEGCMTSDECPKPQPVYQTVGSRVVGGPTNVGGGQFVGSNGYIYQVEKVCETKQKAMLDSGRNLNFVSGGPHTQCYGSECDGYSQDFQQKTESYQECAFQNVPTGVRAQYKTEEIKVQINTAVTNEIAFDAKSQTAAVANEQYFQYQTQLAASGTQVGEDPATQAKLQQLYQQRADSIASLRTLETQMQIDPSNQLATKLQNLTSDPNAFFAQIEKREDIMQTQQNITNNLAEAQRVRLQTERSLDYNPDPTVSSNYSPENDPLYRQKMLDVQQGIQHLKDLKVDDSLVKQYEENFKQMPSRTDATRSTERIVESGTQMANLLEAHASGQTNVGKEEIGFLQDAGSNYVDKVRSQGGAGANAQADALEAKIGDAASKAWMTEYKQQFNSGVVDPAVIQGLDKAASQIGKVNPTAAEDLRTRVQVAPEVFAAQDQIAVAKSQAEKGTVGPSIAESNFGELVNQIKEKAGNDAGNKIATDLEKQYQTATYEGIAQRLINQRLANAAAGNIESDDVTENQTRANEFKQRVIDPLVEMGRTDLANAYQRSYDQSPSVGSAQGNLALATRLATSDLGNSDKDQTPITNALANARLSISTLNDSPEKTKLQNDLNNFNQNVSALIDRKVAAQNFQESVNFAAYNATDPKSAVQMENNLEAARARFDALPDDLKNDPTFKAQADALDTIAKIGNQRDVMNDWFATAAQAKAAGDQTAFQEAVEKARTISKDIVADTTSLPSNLKQGAIKSAVNEINLQELELGKAGAIDAAAKSLSDNRASQSTDAWWSSPRALGSALSTVGKGSSCLLGAAIVTAITGDSSCDFALNATSKAATSAGSWIYNNPQALTAQGLASEFGPALGGKVWAGLQGGITATTTELSATDKMNIGLDTLNKTGSLDAALQSTGLSTCSFWGGLNDCSYDSKKALERAQETAAQVGILPKNYQELLKNGQMTQEQVDRAMKSESWTDTQKQAFFAFLPHEDPNPLKWISVNLLNSAIDVNPLIHSSSSRLICQASFGSLCDMGYGSAVTGGAQTGFSESDYKIASTEVDKNFPGYQLSDYNELKNYLAAKSLCGGAPGVDSADAPRSDDYCASMAINQLGLTKEQADKFEKDTVALGYAAENVKVNTEAGKFSWEMNLAASESLGNTVLTTAIALPIAVATGGTGFGSLTGLDALEIVPALARGGATLARVGIKELLPDAGFIIKQTAKEVYDAPWSGKIGAFAEAEIWDAPRFARSVEPTIEKAQKAVAAAQENLINTQQAKADFEAVVARDPHLANNPQLPGLLDKAQERVDDAQRLLDSAYTSAGYDVARVTQYDPTVFDAQIKLNNAQAAYQAAERSDSIPVVEIERLRKEAENAAAELQGVRTRSVIARLGDSLDEGQVQLGVADGEKTIATAKKIEDATRQAYQDSLAPADEARWIKAQNDLVDAQARAIQDRYGIPLDQAPQVGAPDTRSTFQRIVDNINPWYKPKDDVVPPITVADNAAPNAANQANTNPGAVTNNAPNNTTASQPQTGAVAQNELSPSQFLSNKVRNNSEIVQGFSTKGLISEDTEVSIRFKDGTQETKPLSEWREDPRFKQPDNQPTGNTAANNQPAGNGPVNSGANTGAQPQAGTANQATPGNGAPNTTQRATDRAQAAATYVQEKAALDKAQTEFDQAYARVAQARIANEHAMAYQKAVNDTSLFQRVVGVGQDQRSAINAADLKQGLTQKEFDDAITALDKAVNDLEAQKIKTTEASLATGDFTVDQLAQMRLKARQDNAAAVKIIGDNSRALDTKDGRLFKEVEGAYEQYTQAYLDVFKFGKTPDAAEEARLVQSWNAYQQALTDAGGDATSQSVKNAEQSLTLGAIKVTPTEAEKLVTATNNLNSKIQALSDAEKANINALVTRNNYAQERDLLHDTSLTARSEQQIVAKQNDLALPVVEKAVADQNLTFTKQGIYGFRNDIAEVQLFVDANGELLVPGATGTNVQPVIGVFKKSGNNVTLDRIIVPQNIYPKAGTQTGPVYSQMEQLAPRNWLFQKNISIERETAADSTTRFQTRFEKAQQLQSPPPAAATPSAPTTTPPTSTVINNGNPTVGPTTNNPVDVPRPLSPVDNATFIRPKKYVDFTPNTYDDFIAKNSDQVIDGIPVRTIPEDQAGFTMTSTEGSDISVSTIKASEKGAPTQDALALSQREDGVINLVIADGVGEALIPDVTARLAAGQALGELYASSLDEALFRNIWTDINAVDHTALGRSMANNPSLPQIVREVLQSKIDGNQIGATTLTALQYDPKTGIVRFGSHGDSPILIFRQDGGQIVKVEGSSNNQLAYRRGSTYDPAGLKAGEVTLRPGDTIIAMSDGTNDARFPGIYQGIADRVKAGQTDAQIAEYIRSRMRAEGIEDDISVGIIQHHELSTTPATSSVGSNAPAASAGLPQNFVEGTKLLPGELQRSQAIMSTLDQLGPRVEAFYLNIETGLQPFSRRVDLNSLQETRTLLSQTRRDLARLQSENDAFINQLDQLDEAERQTISDLPSSRQQREQLNQQISDHINRIESAQRDVIVLEERYRKASSAVGNILRDELVRQGITPTLRVDEYVDLYVHLKQVNQNFPAQARTNPIETAARVVNAEAENIADTVGEVVDNTTQAIRNAGNGTVFDPFAEEVADQIDNISPSRTTELPSVRDEADIIADNQRLLEAQMREFSSKAADNDVIVRLHVDPETGELTNPAVSRPSAGDNAFLVIGKWSDSGDSTVMLHLGGNFNDQTVARLNQALIPLNENPLLGGNYVTVNEPIDNAIRHNGRALEAVPVPANTAAPGEMATQISGWMKGTQTVAHIAEEVPGIGPVVSAANAGAQVVDSARNIVDDVADVTRRAQNEELLQAQVAALRQQTEDQSYYVRLRADGYGALYPVDSTASLAPDDIFLNFRITQGKRTVSVLAAADSLPAEAHIPEIFRKLFRENFDGYDTNLTPTFYEKFIKDELRPATVPNTSPLETAGRIVENAARSATSDIAADGLDEAAKLARSLGSPVKGIEDEVVRLRGNPINEVNVITPRDKAVEEIESRLTALGVDETGVRVVPVSDDVIREALIRNGFVGDEAALAEEVRGVSNTVNAPLEVAVGDTPILENAAQVVGPVNNDIPEATVDPKSHLASRSKGKPENNEDFPHIAEDGRSAFVIDGAGGSGNGRLASQNGKDVMRQIDDLTGSREEVEAGMKRAVAETDQHVRSTAEGGYGVVTGAKLGEDGRGQFVVFGHAGDSRGNIFSGGVFTQVTEDQGAILKVFKDLETSGVLPPTSEQLQAINYWIAEAQNRSDFIARVEATGVNGFAALNIWQTRHNIGNGIGLPGRPAQVTTYVRDVKPGDLIVITSDGIHDNLTNTEIARTLQIKAGERLPISGEIASDNIAENLKTEAYARSKQDRATTRAKGDDISAVVITVPPKANSITAVLDRVEALPIMGESIRSITDYMEGVARFSRDLGNPSPTLEAEAVRLRNLEGGNAVTDQARLVAQLQENARMAREFGDDEQAFQIQQQIEALLGRGSCGSIASKPSNATLAQVQSNANVLGVATGEVLAVSISGCPITDGVRNMTALLPQVLVSPLTEEAARIDVGILTVRRAIAGFEEDLLSRVLPTDAYNANFLGVNYGKVRDGVMQAGDYGFYIREDGKLFTSQVDGSRPIAITLETPRRGEVTITGIQVPAEYKGPLSTETLGLKPLQTKFGGGEPSVLTIRRESEAVINRRFGLSDSQVAIEDTARSITTSPLTTLSQAEQANVATLERIPFDLQPNGAGFATEVLREENGSLRRINNGQVPNSTDNLIAITYAKDLDTPDQPMKIAAVNVISGDQQFRSGIERLTQAVKRDVTLDDAIAVGSLSSTSPRTADAIIQNISDDLKFNNVSDTNKGAFLQQVSKEAEKYNLPADVLASVKTRVDNLIKDEASAVKAPVAVVPEAVVPSPQSAIVTPTVLRNPATPVEPILNGTRPQGNVATVSIRDLRSRFNVRELQSSQLEGGGATGAHAAILTDSSGNVVFAKYYDSEIKSGQEYLSSEIAYINLQKGGGLYPEIQGLITNDSGQVVGYIMENLPTAKVTLPGLGVRDAIITDVSLENRLDFIRKMGLSYEYTHMPHFDIANNKLQNVRLVTDSRGEIVMRVIDPNLKVTDLAPGDALKIGSISPTAYRMQELNELQTLIKEIFTTEEITNNAQLRQLSQSVSAQLAEVQRFSNEMQRLSSLSERNQPLTFWGVTQKRSDWEKFDMTKESFIKSPAQLLQEQGLLPSNIENPVLAERNAVPVGFNCQIAQLPINNTLAQANQNANVLGVATGEVLAASTGPCGPIESLIQKIPGLNKLTPLTRSAEAMDQILQSLTGKEVNRTSDTSIDSIQALSQIKSETKKAEFLSATSTVEKVYPERRLDVLSTNGTSAIVYTDKDNPTLVYKVSIDLTNPQYRTTESKIEGIRYTEEEAKKLEILSQKDLAPKLIEYTPAQYSDEEKRLLANPEFGPRPPNQILAQTSLPYSSRVSDKEIIVMEKLESQPNGFIKLAADPAKKQAEIDRVIKVLEDTQFFPGDTEMIVDTNGKIKFIDLGGMSPVYPGSRFEGQSIREAVEERFNTSLRNEEKALSQGEVPAVLCDLSPKVAHVNQNSNVLGASTGLCGPIESLVQKIPGLNKIEKIGSFARNIDESLTSLIGRTEVSNIVDNAPNNLAEALRLNELQQKINAANYHAQVNVVDPPRPIEAFRIDKQKAAEWVAAHPDPESRAVAQAIVDNTQIISQEQFETALKNSVIDFNKTINPNEDYVGLYVNWKSDGWVVDLGLPSVEKLPIDVAELTEIGSFKFNPAINRYAIFDDATYSGNSAVGGIKGLAGELQKAGIDPKGKVVDMVIPFSTKSGMDAARQVATELGMTVNFHGTQNIPTIREIITDPTMQATYLKMRPDNPNMGVKSLDLTLFAFDHKVPDYQSTLEQVFKDGDIVDKDGKYLKRAPFTNAYSIEGPYKNANNSQNAFYNIENAMREDPARASFLVENIPQYGKELKDSVSLLKGDYGDFVAGGREFSYGDIAITLKRADGKEIALTKKRPFTDLENGDVVTVKNEEGVYTLNYADGKVSTSKTSEITEAANTHCDLALKPVQNTIAQANQDSNVLGASTGFCGFFADTVVNATQAIPGITEPLLKTATSMDNALLRLGIRLTVRNAAQTEPNEDNNAPKSSFAFPRFSFPQISFTWPQFGSNSAPINPQRPTQPAGNRQALPEAEQDETGKQEVASQNSTPEETQPAAESAPSEEGADLAVKNPLDGIPVIPMIPENTEDSGPGFFSSLASFASGLVEGMSRARNETSYDVATALIDTNSNLPPLDLSLVAVKPIIDSDRQAREISDPNYDKRVNKALSQDRLNVLVFGYGEEHGESYADLGGSISIISYDLKTGQKTSISLSRDIRAPELENITIDPKTGQAVSSGPVTLREAYKRGGFEGMRELAESATGLAIDYQVVLKDTVIQDYLNQVSGSVAVDINKEHLTGPYKIGGQEYPGGYVFYPGKQILSPDEAIRYMLAEDRNPNGKVDERAYRKSPVLEGMIESTGQNIKTDLSLLPLQMFNHAINLDDQALIKDVKNSTIGRAYDLYNSQVTAGNLVFSFDPANQAQKSAGNLMNAVIDQGMSGLKLDDPDFIAGLYDPINATTLLRNRAERLVNNLTNVTVTKPNNSVKNEVVVHAPGFGDSGANGGVERLHQIWNNDTMFANQPAVNPQVQSEANYQKQVRDQGGADIGYLLIPLGGNPYSKNLEADYWKSVRCLTQYQLTGVRCQSIAP